MTKAVSIAVVGAGLIGQAHIKRILNEPEAVLAAIVDPSPRAKSQAEELGTAYFADIESALRDIKPDGVILATPTTLHVSGALAAIKASIPILLEKPISDDLESAIKLAEASEKTQVPILIGHHRRHSPLIQKAKTMIESGRLGRLTAVNGLCWFRKPDNGYFDGPGAWRRKPGGGVLLINLIHVVDDLRNLCGDVTRVQAVESNAIRKFPVEDTAAILLHFANGALGTLNISDVAAAPWSWEMTAGENKMYPHTDQSCYLIAGTDGALSVPRLELWQHDGRSDWGHPFRIERAVAPEQDPLVIQLKHFCRVIRREVAPLLDCRGGTATLATTLAIKDAAQTGRVVEIACQ